MERLRTIGKTLIYGIALALLIPLAGAKQWEIGSRSFAHTSGGCTLPFTDSFTRANGPLGSNWNNTSAAPIQIISNAASLPPSSSGAQEAFVSCNTFTTAQYAQAVISTLPSSISVYGVVVQASSGTYYAAYCNVSGCSLKSWPGDVFIGAFTLFPTVGQTFCLQVTSGGAIRLKVNGTLDTHTYTETVLSGAPGIFFYTQGTTSDALTNFQGGTGTCP